MKYGIYKSSADYKGYAVIGNKTGIFIPNTIRNHWDDQDGASAIFEASKERTSETETIYIGHEIHNWRNPRTSRDMAIEICHALVRGLDPVIYYGGAHAIHSNEIDIDGSLRHVVLFAINFPDANKQIIRNVKWIFPVARELRNVWEMKTPWKHKLWIMVNMLEEETESNIKDVLRRLTQISGVDRIILRCTNEHGNSLVALPHFEDAVHSLTT